MKKYFLILFFILFSRISYSQVTYHFPHDSAMWTQFTGDWGNGIYGSTHNYLASGDTIINSKTFIKIFTNYSFSSWNQLTDLIREDSTGKVFSRTISDSTEYLYYDFGATQGDTLILPRGHNDYYMMQVVVDSIGFVTLDDGESRRCFYLSAQYDQPKWIEGIGSETGLFMPDGESIPDAMDWLTCFHQHDTLKYHDGNECEFIWGVNNLNEESFFNVSQTNEKTFLLSISKNISSNCELEVMDLLGRKVFTQKISQQKTEINLADLPAGCYVFSLRNKHEIFRKKAMVN